MKGIDVNPVLRRELLERWRGRRAILVLSLYVAVVGLLLLLLRWLGTTILEDRAQWDPAASMVAGPLLGRFMVENLFALVLGLVLLVAPGYAAAQVSGERERRTLGLLRITLVKPRSIVLGKLGAASAWIVLLVLVTAPLATTAIVLGGVVLTDLLTGILVIVVVAVAVAAMALAVSSRARRTTGAVVATYAIVALLVGGTLIGAVVQYAMSDFRRIDLPVALYLNPFMALADATNAQASLNSELPSLLSPLAYAIRPEVFDVWVDDVEPMPMPVPVPPEMEWEELGFAEDEILFMQQDALRARGAFVIEADEAFLASPDVEVLEPMPVQFDADFPPDVPFPEPPGFRGEQRRGTRVWPVTLGLYALLAAGALTLAARSIGPREGVRET